MKAKARKVILIVLSVILSAALTYGAAAAATLSAEYEGGGSAVTDAFARLFADPFPLTFKKTVYNLFGVALDKNVTAGKDGYLFPTKTDEFDYTADIAGAAHYSDDIKSRFLYSLQTRRDALALDGCELYVFVIPNSQTVLQNKLKTINKNGTTAAKDLEKYLYDNGFNNFHLLDDEMQNKEYEVYNNTENTVNGYGAYVIYDSIASVMPDNVQKRSHRLTLDSEDILISYSDGGALAKEAGIEKLVKNKNVTYNSKKFTQAYTSNIHGGVTVCELKDEYNAFLGRSEVLIQIPDNERTLFLPLFSASYTNTVYNNTLSYSNTAASLAEPSVCLYILREDRLTSLLDSEDINTYLSHTDSGRVTSQPEVSSVSYKRSGTAMVAGVCGDGVKVTVRSKRDVTSVVCRDGLFIAELEADNGEELQLYAESDEKERSDTEKCTVPAAAAAEESVFAGGLSMLYYGDTVNGYTGADLIDETRLEKTKNRFLKIRDKIREASGKDTEIIFLTAPDPLTVYPDAASDELYQKKADKTLFDQLKELLSGADGVTFLDIREEMRQNTDIDKLYYQTDTHWTELGAYFGYRAVINAVSQKYPQISPLPLNSFEFTEKSVSGGDLASFAGFSGVAENVRFLKFGSELKAAGIADKPETIDRSVYSAELESKVNDVSLPVAVLIRDSYSANLFPYICEHFSCLYAQRMWDYTPDYGKISECKPDYVIYVIGQRNVNIIFK